MAELWLVSSLFHSVCCTSAGSTDIHDILEILAPSCHKFHELGIGLKLEGTTMELIQHEYDSRRSTLYMYMSLRRVLTEWLKYNYPYETFGFPSLSRLVKAVDMFDHGLAVNVFKEFTARVGKPWFMC